MADKRVVVLFDKNWFEDENYARYDFISIMGLEKFMITHPGVELKSLEKVKIAFDLYAMVVSVDE
jgi:hypothetical protein